MTEQEITKKMVAVLRTKAKELNRTADTLEREFDIRVIDDTQTPPLPAMGSVSVEQVKKALESKAMRIADLAEQFTVQKFEIEKIVSDASVFVKGKMGWITLKQ